MADMGFDLPLAYQGAFCSSRSRDGDEFAPSENEAPRHSLNRARAHACGRTTAMARGNSTFFSSDF